mgnify:CR=1 FL=1
MCGATGTHTLRSTTPGARSRLVLGLAGLALAALTLGWPLAATFSGRLYMRIGFRRTALIGSVFIVTGALLEPVRLVGLVRLVGEDPRVGVGEVSHGLLVGRGWWVDRRLLFEPVRLRDLVTAGVLFSHGRSSRCPSVREPLLPFALAEHCAVGSCRASIPRLA